MNYRLYNCGFIALVLIFLGLVAALNYTMDQAEIFSKGRYEKSIVSLLAKGRNVAIEKNYDERLVQKYYIETTEQANRVLVLGASRVMLINRGMFPGMTFMNHGVSGGTLEDDVAVYEMYLERGFKPEIVIIGLDNYLLNQNHDQTRWHTLDREYLAALARLEMSPRKTDPLGKSQSVLSPNKVAALKQLWSWSYLRASLKELGQPAHPAFAVDLEQQGMQKHQIKRSDGSIIYPEKYTNKSAEELDATVRENSLYPIYSLRDFHAIDPFYQNLFEKFIHHMLQSGIKVVFFMAPYHPLVYSITTSDDRYRATVETEQYFRRFAHSEHIKIIGSWNPAECQASSTDFYDGFHPSRPMVEKIIRSQWAD